MQVAGRSPESGEQLILELEDDKVDEILRLGSLELSKAGLKRKIENLQVSADTKALLFALSTKVIRVGEKVIKIGQKILEVVMKFVSAYPNTSFGIVFGAIAGALVGSVPLIGWVLGPIVMPIMVAVGLVLGAKQDFVDKAMASRVNETIEPFEVLRGRS